MSTVAVTNQNAIGSAAKLKGDSDHRDNWPCNIAQTSHHPISLFWLVTELVAMSLHRHLVQVKCSLVLSWLDYCNSLLIVLLLTHIQRFKPVQNAKSTLIFYLRRDHITDTLISLHWLTFRLVMLKYRALHGSALPYLASSFARLCCRHATSIQAQVRFPNTSTFCLSVNGRRSCLSCRSKVVE